MKKYRLFNLVLVVALLAGLLLPFQSLALEPPEFHGKNAILVDANYNEVLYEVGGHDKVYPASITKVMTALLTLEAIEAGQLTAQTQVTASATATTVPEGSSTANPKIQAGEVLTVEQLLYCLLLPSANEAAQILAETVGGDMETFVGMMNDKAKELGCENTHFANPHGFHDPDHYTTTYDITLFMKAAMEYDLFQKIVTSPNYTIPATNLNGERTVRNTNALTSNWTYTGYLYGPGTGGKTGSTDEAGKCLVETAKDGDTYLISVVMGEPETITLADGTEKVAQFYDTIQLLEWGFKNFHRTVISQDSEVVAKVNVTLSTQTDQVMVRPSGSIARTLPKDVDVDQMEKQINLFSDTVEAPVEQGQLLGTMRLLYQGEEYGVLDLVADSSVERSELLYRLDRIQKFFQNWWVKLLLVIVVVAVAALLLRVFVFRKRRRYSGVGASRRGRYSGRRRK